MVERDRMFLQLKYQVTAVNTRVPHHGAGAQIRLLGLQENITGDRVRKARSKARVLLSMGTLIPLRIKKLPGGSDPGPWEEGLFGSIWLRGRAS